MADKVIVSKSKLTALGNAIRGKTGKTENLTLDTMTTEIANIETGITPTGALDITENGTYDVTNYASANVNVASENNLLQKRFNAHNGYGLFAYFQGTSVDDYITNLDLSNLTNCSYMFSDAKVKTIPQLDTSKVINMMNMFEHNSYLESIPQLDTSKVTNMSSLFLSCSNLESIPPQLNTSAVTNMMQMFSYCNKLKSIPQLDTSKVTSMNYAFRSCYILQKIDITSMDKITSISASNTMCDKCYSLTKFIIRTMTVIPALNSSAFNNCYHFNGTVNTTYNPDGLKDGRIYVPDNMVDSLKSATNWSTYADIIVPLSTLEE